MSKNTILIADDAELNREILTEMLGSQYNFIYACDGAEAIDILGSGEEIDLLLLDVNMPNKNGFDVLDTMNKFHWIQTIPVIIISAESDPGFIKKAYELGVTDYINRPFNSFIVQHRVENTLLLYSNQKRLIRLVESQVYEREKINNSMINIFSDVIETRNQESGNHTLNVQVITSLLLNRLAEITDRYDLSKSDISLISTLSALHDIGKIKIPESVLNKPGKLDDNEWKIMKSHTTEGDAILSSPELDQDSKFVKTARGICRWHHEKYDGHGYPDGLVGDEIPIAAQVVSLADVYDALTSERCYKPAFTHEKAIEMMVGGECGVFNPLLLQCLSDVSDALKSLVHGSKANHYDYGTDAVSVANEILESDNLPSESRLLLMLEHEHRKKEFFMDCNGGISFEYDKLQGKVTFINTTDPNLPKRKEEFTSITNENNVLPAKYWDALRKKVLLAGSHDAVITMPVKLNINGELVPYMAKVMAIWPEESAEYISVVGHLVQED